MTSATIDRRIGLSGNTAVKAPVTAIATGNITQSGEQTIDGVAVLASNAAGVPDRVLCVGMTDATKNGIWDVQTSAWTRSPDANGNLDLANGTQVLVSRGSAAKQVWVLTSSDPITIGTTSQTWSQNLSAGFLATLAALSGAGLIGHGATTSYSALTVGGSINDIALDVNAYSGIDPTGVADSTSALNTMLGLIGSGYKIRFRGTYKITGAVTFDGKAVTVDALGATFNLSGNNAGFVVKGNVARFEVFGGTIVGDGVSRATSTVAQIGWMFGNEAGANVRNVLVHGVSIQSTNIGLKFAPGTGGGSGNPTNCRVIACAISGIRGTASGVGYGVQMTQANGSMVAFTDVDDCDRHGIYFAEGERYYWTSNTIRNHRQTANNSSFRAALVISRCSKVEILGGEILDAYDGQLEISHDTSTSSNCTDVDIIGLRLTGRKNGVTGVMIGEQAVPTSYLTSDVRLDLRITDDHTVVGGSPAITVQNGSGLSFAGTKIKRTAINGTTRLVSLGNAVYISADAHCTDTVLQNMELICEGSVLTDTRVIDIDADICGNTSRHRIGPNFYKNAAFEAYTNAALTNPNVVIQDSAGTIQIPYTAGDTTPSVANLANYLEVSNAGAVSLTALDDGVKGQRVLLRNVGAGTCTLLAANFYVPGAVNLVLGTNDNATLFCRATGGQWEVIASSNN